MWKKATFPFPAGSLVGRAANQAYLQPESGCKWARIPRGIAFVWSGNGEAVGLNVILDEQTHEVHSYELRFYSSHAVSPLDDVITKWQPRDDIASSWCAHLKQYFGDKKWDEKAARKVLT